MNKEPDKTDRFDVQSIANREPVSLSKADIDNFGQSFREQSANRVARNAVVNAKAKEVGLNRDAVIDNVMTFSNEVSSGDITHQKRSGRCWAFAALNRLRLDAMEKMNLDSFEFSAAYVMFWDKLEKANFFLENIIQTADESVDSRLVQWLLSSPMSDAGQWDMFVNIVEKYGLVPQDAYPETTSSNATARMNTHLTEKLREWASELRAMVSQNASVETLRERKEQMLETVYRILSIHNGEPPESFNWAWRDKDDEFHQAGELTPREFFDRFVDFPFDEYVSLLHCPTGDKPFNQTYTVEYLGNVAEGRPIEYLNVDIDILKEAAKSCIRRGEAVWFGCDVGKRLHKDKGILDDELFEFDALYRTDFAMDKGQRVQFGHSQMTHAMLFTGLHLDGSEPVRWKVENSWGEEAGQNGFLVMSDDWFDEYVFQVVVPKSHLPERQRKLLEDKPVVLPPWDPMGGLAVRERS